MSNLKGKRLLVLGSTYSTINIVRLAKEQGIYVITASKPATGPAADLADERVEISTNDYNSLLQLISDKKVDGVMTGSGEFNILNMIRLCKMANLPVYANEEQWDVCQNKRNFKDLCKKYGVPGVPEYSNAKEIIDNDYPVIVKPVDGCSSRGINVCYNAKETEEAITKAIAVSPAHEVLIEKYINNGGLTHVVKYAVVDGHFYMEVMGDRYVVDGGLITAITFFPSLSTRKYIDTIDGTVQKMFKGIHYDNGVFFLQAIPDKENIYIYEMGLRTGGGMTYKITEATGGNNDLKMLLNYALTKKMCIPSEIEKFDYNLKEHRAASLAFPLKLGKIAQVKGLDVITNLPSVVNVTSFYNVGDTIEQKHINTLDQLFARVMLIAENEKQLLIELDKIRSEVSVKDEKGEEMIMWSTFDRIIKERKNV